MAGFLLSLLLLVAPALSYDVKAECGGFQVADRFDCHPEADASAEKCEARGCCWAQLETRLPSPNAPWCFYPKDYSGYSYENWTSQESGGIGYLRRNTPSPYPRDVQLVRIDVEHQTDTRLRIKLSDAQNQRYETPYPKLTSSKSLPRAPTYQVDINKNLDGFQVKRSTGETIFNTRGIGGFIFADQFLQISSTFSGHIYGLGEHRTPNLWLSTNWTRFTMFNRDIGPGENINLYGSHSFYLVVADDGSSYGVYLHNSNAMDVLLQPLDAITFRPIGGIFDFYFFLGPTPSDVVRQYTELIGRPYVPPYWSLGFHLCRWGYGSTNNTRAVWQRIRDAGIPFDAQWNDIDYMITQNDFTIDPNNYGDLGQFVDEVHAAGMKYVPILDPGVSAAEPAGSYPPFDDGLEMDVFVKKEDGSVYIGKVWNPVSTAYPDFFHPRALEYWTKQIKEFYNRVKFDGLWIDMNEPSNFVDGFEEGCPQTELDYPPYQTGVEGDLLAKKTLCMTAKQAGGIFYNVHNLYSISEAEVTNNALRSVTGKRPFVLSRSTFAGSGTYTSHWGGDNGSDWYHLVQSIAELLNFNLFGIPHMGSDICGFGGEASEALCNRWMQLGAFYTFSRNHNSIGARDQDPAAYGQMVIDSSKKALNVRYTLLPYLYTLFYHAHVHGDTVARPLFFEFPGDAKAREVDRAFLWGSAIYIIPVLEEGKTEVTAYFPPGKWYDWYSGKVSELTTGADITLSAPLDTIPVFIRGGNVLPTQAPDVTTTASRKNNFTLIAAGDSQGAASGSLFWDDGESIDTIDNNTYGLVEFSLSASFFKSSVVTWNTKDIPWVDRIKVLGLTNFVTYVTVNGRAGTFIQDENKALIVTNINYPITMELNIIWS